MLFLSIEVYENKMILFSHFISIKDFKSNVSTLLKIFKGAGMVVHTCNLSYKGGRDRKITVRG
jgi:hypothetical protein